MRLIDAEGLFKDLSEGWHTNNKEYAKTLRQIILDVITPIIVNQPTVDPIKHGKWETNSDIPDTLICSNCKANFDMYFYESDELHYCPHCGAKMDKEK